MKSHAFAYQDAAKRLLEEGEKNLLIVAPTGSGKTSVGFTAFEIAGKGVFIAPTRALCHEKMQWLRQQFPNARTVIGNKDYGLRASEFAAADYRVITPWKLNQLLQNRADFPVLSPVVVLDELQAMSRDPDVEMVITKLLALFDGKIRIVGLSASLHEDDVPKIAAWLNGVTVESDERPVPIIEHIVNFSLDLDGESGEEVTDVKILEQGHETATYRLTRPVSANNDAVLETARYIRQTMEDSAPMLVYTPYQERSRQLSQRLAEFQRELGVQYDEELAKLAEGLPNEAGDFTWSLKEVLPYRIGIHHGGMTQAERELVFDLASAGRLDFVVTCLTLAHGVNLPARHLIIESVYDFDETGERRLMDLSLFRNLSGRVGRPQFDSIGYVWLPTLTEIERIEIEEVLLKHKASRIQSRVYNKYFLTSQVSGLILLGFNTAAKLAGFLKRTFWGMAQNNITPMVDQFEQIIVDLVDRDVVKIVGPLLTLTPKGQRIARLGVHPAEYDAMAALIAQSNASYEDWVRNLAQACREYVVPDLDAEEIEGIVNVVANYGLAIYSVKSHHKAKDFADYVGRLLEIAASLMQIDVPAEEFVAAWREDVFLRYAYGNLQLARRLAPFLRREQLKRLVRNIGLGLANDWTDGQWHDDPTASATFKFILKMLWEHLEQIPNGEVTKVAEALGVSTQEIYDEIDHLKLHDGWGKREVRNGNSD